MFTLKGYTMIKFNTITKNDTYIEMDGDNGYRMFVPSSQAMVIDDESGAVMVKPISSRKVLGYAIK